MLARTLKSQRHALWDAVADNAFTRLKTALSGLPVHFAPLCAGSNDSLQTRSLTFQAARLPAGFPARRVLVPSRACFCVSLDL